jgi:hypothetical protein
VLSGQELRGGSHPLQCWQSELLALEDEASLELPPCIALIEALAFHKQVRYET